METVVHLSVDVFPTPGGGFYTDDVYRVIRIHTGSYCCIRIHTLCNVQNEWTSASWDMIPCTLVVRYKRSGHNSCFHLQNRIVSYLERCRHQDPLELRYLVPDHMVQQHTWLSSRYIIIRDCHLGTSSYLTVISVQHHTWLSSRYHYKKSKSHT
jgi:hypothetical protein